MRNCPVCNSDKRELVLAHETTMRGHQDIWSCLPCGMIYADSETVTYAESIYSEPGSTGSGESDEDKARLAEAARVVAMNFQQTARILDVGCAQGGMLDALKQEGFTNLVGIDPSHACCNATIKRGFKAIPVSLQHVGGKFDCIVFSHVLEHVEDPAEMLRTALSKLEFYGRIYIEVPDAQRYVLYDNLMPLLDFNSEHINHFTAATMASLLGSCGFEVIGHHTKSIGPWYPAIFFVAQRRTDTMMAMSFVKNSQYALNCANENLFDALNAAGATECVLWGAGEYLAKVIDLPVFKIVKVRHIFDRNPALHGKVVRGVTIGPFIETDLPIVIASAINSQSIRASIEALGIPNKIIELEFA